MKTGLPTGRCGLASALSTATEFTERKDGQVGLGAQTGSEGSGCDRIARIKGLIDQLGNRVANSAGPAGDFVSAR